MTGNVSERGLHRRGEIRRPATTARRLGAERGIAVDLLVGRLCVPEEVAGWIDADHHRAMDALRVAPGIDHRGAGARAFAHQVDLVVAEGAAGRLEVVDFFGDRIAGEIDTIAAEPVGARAVRRGDGAVRLLAEEVTRVLHRRAHLRAVEPGRSVDAAVADEHDVVLGGETARVREHHVGDAGAALEAEDRDTRMGRMGTNHYDRKCDQARASDHGGSRARRASRNPRRRCRSQSCSCSS